MRLLRVNPNGSFSLTSVIGNRVPRYAVLSHTWETDDQEVTFQDLVDGLGESKDGYRKIQFCGRQATLDGLQYFWVDSCCIDKSSSAELAEAINSMFRWYRDAAKCYVYLTDVPNVDVESRAFCRSRWFTRGWTLQELLAPSIVEFFSHNGRRIGDKQSLELQIHYASGIPVKALQHNRELFRYSIDERMLWTAKRETTLEEDQAYCLTGIFDVHLLPIYGEGKDHAFGRLRNEISSKHTQDARDVTDASRERVEACLSNLVATDQTRFLSQALARSKHSCTWILEHQQYVAWQQSKMPSFLWISAKAGCGKTTVAAHLCQMVSTQQVPAGLGPQENKSEAVVLYFFFQRSNDEVVRTAQAALRTIIRQLVRQVPAVLPILLARHDLLSAKGDFEWSWDAVAGVLGEMLQQLPLGVRAYLILDALDEGEAESRILLVEWMKGLVDDDPSSTPSRRNKAMLKILVTGRPDGDMIDHLSAFPTLEMTDTDTADDVRVLIHYRTEELARQRRLKPNVTRSIVQFLESNAHGMFLWVVLIMRELESRNERLSDEAIASKLSRTPLSLSDTYKAILRNVPPARKYDLWRIIRWLLFGSRSLTLAELEAGLCLETGISNWHDFEGDLRFLCGSLLQLGGPRDEVNFIHQTTRDFFETFPRTSYMADVDEYFMDTNSANERLATICVQYLLRDEIFRELTELLRRIRTRTEYFDVIQGFLDRHILLCYAIESWAFHTRSVKTPSPGLSAMVQMLLSSQARRDNIMTLTFHICKHVNWGLPHGGSPLHLAAYFNIPWFAQTYILKDRSSVNTAKTCVNDTPLIWASEMGSTECASLLLDAGADPNEFEYDGWSALHWAATNGHLEIAKMLLEHGASTSQRDWSGHTPVDWAIDREHSEVADLIRQWSELDDPRELGGLLPRVWEGLTKRGQTSRNTWQLWDNRP